MFELLFIPPAKIVYMTTSTCLEKSIAYKIIFKIIPSIKLPKTNTPYYRLTQIIIETRTKYRTFNQRSLYITPPPLKLVYHNNHTNIQTHIQTQRHCLIYTIQNTNYHFSNTKYQIIREHININKNLHVLLRKSAPKFCFPGMSSTLKDITHLLNNG